ncbi:class I SAM-dependent methyltransferase [Polynucleobacter sp. AP-Sanab-80-C2]|uniref:class I SAM-dependent methyltransferase n=1 Tax=Polynucleobacter sp. AP-Sanab-80-C2 TaxID=3108274 RepID=UPI002B22ABC0|nr:class I SAM-dependent methyltransferase [Polynucleobacter sp. AP-Sanab-80-C2]MEA9598550.1 class I SAM-dependent methyltransferase [Polynucleobacter sp. AP-Sanab-80-C2]
MNQCRVCRSKIKAFMSFGQMPIANGFLNKNHFEGEYFFELAPAFCENCGMFQLMEQPDPKKMFHSEYAFFSSLSKHMQEHFRDFAKAVKEIIPAASQDTFVVELGSNDGIMLRHFKEGGYRHLGIEPSQNVADVAKKNGIETISEFFDLELAKKLVNERGHADAILAANVMCHIPNIQSVAAGISHFLKPGGVLIFEDPYLGDMIAKTSYDQIYDEHVFIFSATSVAYAFGLQGLELIDVQAQSTHGGSMRYVLAHKGARNVSKNVKELLEQERFQGLNLAETYLNFKSNCERSKSDLVKKLKELKKDGKRVVGYGATSKSTTVLNYCQINGDLIEFISDTTPIKQGKVTPGMHIPVFSHDKFNENYPEYALLFAWNHAKEIFEKEDEFRAAGGRWVLFVPDLRVI